MWTLWAPVMGWRELAGNNSLSHDSVAQIWDMSRITRQGEPHFLEKVLSLLNGLGTLVKNQWVRDVRVYFWPLLCSICLCLAHASTILDYCSCASCFYENFYWSRVDLQCCDFCSTAEWLSHTNIYILFHFLFHDDLSQDIGYSCLCYTVGPCCLSILYVIVRIC